LFALFALGGNWSLHLFLMMEDRSWMYDDVAGDPLLYFKHITQFVEVAKTHTLGMNKKEI
jgi:hypothetical protein